MELMASLGIDKRTLPDLVLACPRQGSGPQSLQFFVFVWPPPRSITTSPVMCECDPETLPEQFRARSQNLPPSKDANLSLKIGIWVIPRIVRSVSVRSKWAGLELRKGPLLHPNGCPRYVKVSLSFPIKFLQGKSPAEA